MVWTARYVLASLAIGGCLGPVPEPDYEATTGDTTTSSDPPTTSSTTPSTSTSASTTSPATTSMSTSEPETTDPDSTTSDTTTGSDSSSDSSSSTTTGPVLPHGPCSPAPTELMVMQAGGIYSVSNEEIAVEFDQANNYTASSLTTGGGSELLLTADNPSERLTGIGYFVSPGVDEYSWRGTDATLTVLEEGPAVVRLQVEWSTDDATTDAALSGTTVYTIIPDGRLMRDETLQFMHSSTPEGSSYLTAYMSLDASEFDQVQSSFPFVNCRNELVCEVGDAAEVAIYGYGIAELDTWMCGTHDLSSHSVSWMIDSASPTGDVQVSARLSEVNEGGVEHSLAMQYDWVRGTATALDEYTIDVLAYVAEDDSDCACSLEHFEAYGEHPDADDAKSSGVSSVNYRIWGAYYDVGITADTFELTFEPGPLPPTMLLRLEGRTTVTDVAIDGDGLTDGDDYLWQVGMQDENTAWLYLARPLAEGETLTITASP